MPAEEPADGPAEQTTVAPVPQPDNDETMVAAPVLDEDDDEFVEDDDDEVRQIDATLARFSAVHDQIAEEEAERRKKLSWLFGMRKEPELGRDMPFDFVEGRDAGASRMDWKKEQRKRRSKRTWQVAAVAAVLIICVVTGIGLIA